MKTVKELSEILTRQVETVCSMLLPAGKMTGGMWVCGDLSGGEGKSLQVNLTGPHIGKWRDWAESDFHGDLIDLWREAKGLSPKQAIAEVRDFLGIVAPVEPMRKKEYGKPIDTHRDPSPNGPVYTWFAEERKIEPSIVNRFSIKGKATGHNGSSQVFIVFPSFSPEGEWVNSSYRGLKLDENGKKQVFQDKGCAPALFGWQALDKRAFEKRSVILCEGQIDAMTWTQWGFDALSIPNGNGTTWIEYEWENLEVFETIYLSFDMDGKTKDALQKVISRLGAHRCLVVKLPDKDANDCLKAGYTGQDAAKWIEAAKHPKIPDFVSLTDLEERLLNEFFPDPNAPKALEVSLFEAKYDDDKFLIRPGELSVWTGTSSHGKTTFLTYLFTQFAYKGETSFICSLEQKPEKISKKMALSIFREHSISPEDIREFVRTLGERTCFCDRIGYISQKDLLDMMEFAHRRYGVTQFMVDSLMRIQGLEENYPAQGDFLNLLCEFAKKFMVHVHLVVHPKKMKDDTRISITDLKGSSLLTNNADNILVVCRNTAKDRMRMDGASEEELEAEHDTMVTVEKDREEGKVKSFRYRFILKHQYFTLMKSEPKLPPSENGASGSPQQGSGRKFGNSYPPKKFTSR